MPDFPEYPRPVNPQLYQAWRRNLQMEAERAEGELKDAISFPKEQPLTVNPFYSAKGKFKSYRPKQLLEDQRKLPPGIPEAFVGFLNISKEWMQSS